MRPGLAVTLEFAVALADALCLTWRVPRYLLQRERLVRDLQHDLAARAGVEDPGATFALPNRPLHFFLSCAEPSGEIHAAGLMQALRAELRARGAPEPRFAGLGGRRLAELGLSRVGDPVRQAAMGLDVLRTLPFYVGLLQGAASYLAHERPDLVIAVDSPALHVPLGRLSHRYGVPVVHFVAPQYWAWAPWRVGRYRSAVDLALAILPFERSWFERHGVHVAYVGHPLLDALPARAAPDGSPPGARLVLLAGSRTSVIARNLPWMLAAAARLRLALPAVEIVVLHDRAECRADLERCVCAAGAQGWARIEIGDLHAGLARARCALSVSGTILIDLLHERLPTVVVYRLANPLAPRLRKRVLTVPFFSSVNLLAGEEVLPEHCFHGEGPLEAVTRQLERALCDAGWRTRTRAGLERAAQHLGPPGALRRAARQALSLLSSSEG
jgi:lipid-A-disaccharide synthase